MRQCFAVFGPRFRLTSDRVRVFGRIVKKLTNSLFESQTDPKEECPEATATDRGLLLKETTVNVSFLSGLPPKGSYETEMREERLQRNRG